MSRHVTYDENQLPQLAGRLVAIRMKLDALGYGSRAVVAHWLIKNGYQKGAHNNRKDINNLARKIAHICKGYVRGIHATMHAGGVWSGEEAEKMADLIEKWLSTNPVSESQNFESFLRTPRKNE